MKEALIDPRVDVYKYDGTLLGKRVAEATTSPFEVAPPLFWVACNDDVVADEFFYDTVTYLVEPIPQKPPPEPTGEPTVI